MLIVLVAADSVEYWTASFDEFSVLRVWMSAIGYSLRPAIICVVIAVVCESILKYEGMINTTGAVTIVFYYLYINTQQIKRDALTGVMKRRYFYLDGEIFCLSIDKNQSEYIDLGIRKIKIYPDTLDNIVTLIKTTSMSIADTFETEFAHIIICTK